MGDRSRHQDAAAVGDMGEPGGGAHALGVEPGSCVNGGVLLGTDAGGGEVGGGQFENTHPGQCRGVDLAESGQHAGLLTGGGGRRPQRCPPTAGAETVERSCRGQGLHLPDAQPGAAGEVTGGGVGAVGVALVGDGGGQVGADGLDRFQSEPHLGPLVLAGGAAEGSVDAGSVHGDAVPPGVGDEGLGRVEAHGLAA